VAVSLDPECAAAAEPRERLCATLTTRQEQIAARMLRACLDGARTRAVSLTEFATSVFPEEQDVQRASGTVLQITVSGSFAFQFLLDSGQLAVERTIRRRTTYETLEFKRDRRPASHAEFRSDLALRQAGLATQQVGG